MSKSYAGYFLEERQSSHNTEIEYWTATNTTSNPIVRADVYMLPHSYKNLLENLPRYGAFAPFSVIEQKNRLVVVVPRTIQLSIKDIQERVGVTGLVCFMWHVSAHLSELHQIGRSHGMLHASHIGIDEYGKVSIRPAFADFIPSEPDSSATATATDCWQLFFVLQSMGIDSTVDARFSLLMRGLQQDIARLRLQPATAIRQTITAVLARHAEWETKFIEYFGADWKLEVLQRAEESVIPHRLEKSIKKEYNKPIVAREEFDVWGNPFVSQRAPTQSSAQALLQQAFQSVPKMQISLPALDSVLEEDIDMEKGRLQIDLQISNSPLQLQIQEENLSSPHNSSSIMAIKEIYDDMETITVPNHRTSQRNDISIVEEYESINNRYSVEENEEDEEYDPVVQELFERSIELATESVPNVNSDIDRSADTAPDNNIVDTRALDAEEDTENSEENVSEEQGELLDDLSLHVVLEEPVEIAEQSAVEDKEDEKEEISQHTSSLIYDVQDTSQDPFEQTVVIAIDTMESSNADISHSQDVLETNEQDLPTLSIDLPMELEEDVVLIEHVDVLSTATAEPSAIHTVVDDMQIAAVTHLNDTSFLVEEGSSDEEDKDEDKVDVVEEKNTPSIVIQDSFIVTHADEEDVSEDVSDDVYEEMVYRNPVINIASMARSVVEDDSVPNSSKPVIIEPQNMVDNVENTTAKERYISHVPLPIEDNDIYEDYTENIESTNVQSNSLHEMFEEFPTQRQHEKGTPQEKTKKLSGFVADLDVHPVAMVEVELDVEEPLADISFPSIEEVRANTAMRKDVNDLFAQESARIKLPPVSAVNIRSDIVDEPKWAQATSVQEQSGSEGLGDEKYATDSANFGDIDAVLNTDIRGSVSQIEEKGSWWGMLLIIAIVMVFVVVYVAKPVPMEPTATVASEENIESIDTMPAPTNCEITTTPPGGRVFVDKDDKGVEPVVIDSLDKELYLICVDWGTNPVCRNVPKSDLQRKGGYIFIK